MASIFLENLEDCQGAPWCTKCSLNSAMAKGLCAYLGEGPPSPFPLKETDIHMESQCPRCIIASDFIRKLTSRIVAREDKDIEEALGSIQG